jgi:hypothetical protein
MANSDSILLEIDSNSAAKVTDGMGSGYSKPASGF